MGVALDVGPVWPPVVAAGEIPTWPYTMAINRSSSGAAVRDVYLADVLVTTSSLATWRAAG